MAPAEKRTVLLVECESLVRDAVRGVLDEGSFQTFDACSAAEAMVLAANFEGEIHLLLAAVTLPDLSGPDLAKKIKLVRPSTRVMLMSGYPNGSLLVLNYGWHFIQKPFLPSILLNKIQDLLSGESREQEPGHFDTRV